MFIRHIRAKRRLTWGGHKIRAQGGSHQSDDSDDGGDDEVDVGRAVGVAIEELEKLVGSASATLDEVRFVSALNYLIENNVIQSIQPIPCSRYRLPRPSYRTSTGSVPS